MQKIFTYLNTFNINKISNIIHLGAGECKELSKLQQFNSKSIVLIEANPALAAKLRINTEGVDNVVVVEAVVTKKPGNTTFWITNDPNESSTLRPVNLLKWYPNLKTVQEVTVSGKTMEQIEEIHHLNFNENNLLMIETQGSEVDIISSTDAKVMQRFSWIAVRTSRDVLYEGGANQKGVEVVLSEFGFTPVVIEANTNDEVPFQEYLYKRNDKFLKIVELQKQLDSVQKENSSKSQSIENQAVLINKLQNQNQQVIEDRNKQIQNLKNLNIHFEELSQKHRQLEQELAELKNLSDTLTNEKNALFQAREEQTKLAGERQVQIQQMTKKLDEKDQKIRNQQSWLEAFKNEKASLLHTNEEQAKLTDERNTQIQQLTEEKDHQSQLAKNGEIQVQQLTKAMNELSLLAEEREVQIQQLTREKNEQSKLAIDRGAEIQKLTNQRNDHTSHIEELQKRIETLRQEKDKLIQEKNASIQESNEKIFKLENALLETKHRQKLLDQEIIKAEAQIDLVTDILLREPEL